MYQSVCFAHDAFAVGRIAVSVRSLYTDRVVSTKNVQNGRDVFTLQTFIKHKVQEIFNIAGMWYCARAYQTLLLSAFAKINWSCALSREAHSFSNWNWLQNVTDSVPYVGIELVSELFHEENCINGLLFFHFSLLPPFKRHKFLNLAPFHLFSVRVLTKICFQNIGIDQKIILKRMLILKIKLRRLLNNNNMDNEEWWVQYVWNKQMPRINFVNY